MCVRSTVVGLGCRLGREVVQCVTGHGYFASWYARTGRSCEQSCSDCGAVLDDAAHVLLDCLKWADCRGRLLGAVDRSNLDLLLEESRLEGFETFARLVAAERRTHLHI